MEDAFKYISYRGYQSESLKAVVPDSVHHRSFLCGKFYLVLPTWDAMVPPHDPPLPRSLLPWVTKQPPLGPRDAAEPVRGQANWPECWDPGLAMPLHLPPAPVCPAGLMFPQRGIPAPSSLSCQASAFVSRISTGAPAGGRPH